MSDSDRSGPRLAGVIRNVVMVRMRGGFDDQWLAGLLRRYDLRAELAPHVEQIARVQFQP